MQKTNLAAIDLIRSCERENFALPFFQRDYVWEKKDITAFLDSMSRCWPVGSIIFWNKPGLHGRKFGSLRGNPKEIVTDMLVLDGQQRITTLLLLFKDGKIDLNGTYGKTTPFYFFFDLEAIEFIASANDKLDSGRFIDVESILRSRVDWRNVAKKYRITRNQRLTLQNLRSLPEYVFPAVYTSVTTDEDAIDIFNRVNTTGKRVDKTELAFALLRDKEHDVSRKIATFQAEWVREGFDLTPKTLINSFLIIKNINDENYYVRTRNADSQIRDYLSHNPRIAADWKNVFKRINDALAFLRQVGFDSDQFIPSENAIAALAGFFEVNDIKQHELSTMKRNSLKRWLFRTLLFGRYTYTTNFEKDLRSLKVKRRLPEPKIKGEKISDDGLIALMYVLGRSKHMTDYWGDEIAWIPTARARHIIHIDHIYPRSRLTKDPILSLASKESYSVVDDIGNKAFAIGQSNTSKNKKFPGEEGRIAGQWMERLQLLSESDYNQMCKSAYSLKSNWRVIRGFVQERHKRILREVRREIK